MPNARCHLSVVGSPRPNAHRYLSVVGSSSPKTLIATCRWWEALGRFQGSALDREKLHAVAREVLWIARSSVPLPGKCSGSRDAPREKPHVVGGGKLWAVSREVLWISRSSMPLPGNPHFLQDFICLINPSRPLLPCLPLSGLVFFCKLQKDFECEHQCSNPPSSLDFWRFRRFWRFWRFWVSG